MAPNLDLCFKDIIAHTMHNGSVMVILLGGMYDERSKFLAIFIPTKLWRTFIFPLAPFPRKFLPTWLIIGNMHKYPPSNIFTSLPLLSSTRGGGGDTLLGGPAQGYWLQGIILISLYTQYLNNRNLPLVAYKSVVAYSHYSQRRGGGGGVLRGIQQDGILWFHKR